MRPQVLQLLHFGHFWKHLLPVQSTRSNRPSQKSIHGCCRRNHEAECMLITPSTSWGPTIHAYSKCMYPCMHSTVSTSTKSSCWGARFWHPHTTNSFYSEEFQAWGRERGTTHLTGAPYHPATNGAFMQALCKSALDADPSGTPTSQVNS